MTDVQPPAPAEAEEQTPENALVRDRALFDKIAAKYKEKAGEAEEQKPMPVPPSASEPPKPPPPAEEETKITEDEAPKPAPPEKKKEEEKPEVPAEALTKAKEFLRLKASARKGALDKMDPDEVLEWASDVRERESNVDARLRERADALKELDEIKSKATADAEEREPKPEPALDPDRKAAMDTLTAELALSDEGRAALEKFADALTAPLRTEIDAVQKQGHESSMREVAKTTNSARAELTERFRGLADDETWTKVLATARSTENGPDYGGKEGARFEEYLPRLLESSARFHGLSETDDQAAATAKAEADAERTQRIADGPTVDSRATPPHPQSKEAQDWEVFQRVTAKHRGKSAVG